MSILLEGSEPDSESEFAGTLLKCADSVGRLAELTA
jgi:hypothetical protein